MADGIFGWRGRLLAGVMTLSLLGSSATQAFAGKLIDREPAHTAASSVALVPKSSGKAQPLSPLNALEADGVTYSMLYVPFVHQLYDTDAAFDGNCACGPTSLAMVLAYFGRITPEPTSFSKPFPHNSQYGYAVTSSGYTYAGVPYTRALTDCAGKQGNYAGLYGALLVSDWDLETQWQRLIDTATAHGLSVTEHRGDDLTFDVLKTAIDQGHPVILATLGLTGAGHLLVATGYTSDGRVIANDPYGAKGYGYPNYSGYNAVYSWEDFGTIPTSWEIGGAPEGWTAQYFDAQGGSHLRYDRELNFDWGMQGPEAPLGPDTFSARWTRDFVLEQGSWNAHLVTDGDARVRIDGTVVFEQFDTSGAGVRDYTFTVGLGAGTHNLQVEYRHNPGDPAVLKFGISRP